MIEYITGIFVVFGAVAYILKKMDKTRQTQKDFAEKVSRLSEGDSSE